MSDLAAVGMLVGLGIAAVWLYFYIDNSIERRADGIVTGVIRGVMVPNKHRWALLNLRWFGAMAVLVCYYLILAIGFVLIGRNVDAEEVRLLAYLSAFFASAASWGNIAYGAVLYFHFRSLLRRAEAD